MPPKRQSLITRSKNTEKILSSMPSEVRNTIKMLSDDTRLAIILMLLKEGQKSFSELSDDLGVPRNILSHHLKALAQAALVRNYYKKTDKTGDYSFYEPTHLTEDFVEGTVGILEPLKSRTDALDNIYFACKIQAMGTAKLLEALHNYSDNVSLSSTTVVSGGMLGISLPLPIRKNMLRVK